VESKPPTAWSRTKRLYPGGAQPGDYSSGRTAHTSTVRNLDFTTFMTMTYIVFVNGEAG
jgi:hypothetical protein